MAVVSFKEIHKGREGGEALEGKSRTVSTHVRVFLCFTDDNDDDETVVKAHASCPQVGDVHPNDSDAYCRTVRARNEESSKRIWIVTVEYSDERELTLNPILEPAEITWATQSYQRPYVKDRDGYGIVNSAGDPPDPPIEGDDSRWVASIVKNVESVPTWLLTYRDAINSDAIVIDGVAIAAGYAKLMDLAIGKQEKRGTFSYRVVTITIALDSLGWSKQMLDQGFREVVGTTGNRQNVKNEDGEDVTAPVLLDGSGGQLSNPGPTNAVFLTKNIYKSLPFSALPLS